MKNEQLLKTTGAVQKLHCLRKNTQKNLEGGEGGGGARGTPTGKWGLKQNVFVSLRPDEEICLIYGH